MGRNNKIENDPGIASSGADDASDVCRLRSLGQSPPQHVAWRPPLPHHASSKCPPSLRSLNVGQQLGRIPGGVYWEVGQRQIVISPDVHRSGLPGATNTTLFGHHMVTFN